MSRLKLGSVLCVVIIVLHDGVPAAAEPAQKPPAASGCMRCHEGIEPIIDPKTKMYARIRQKGRSMGDPEGCVVCHGGDPAAEQKEAAHGGTFYPDPGSPWVNEHTCGQCHPDHVRVQWSSLMMTEAGKIQGVTWSFGGLTGYEHRWGNYDFQNPDDPSERLGTAAYRTYMQRLAQLEPQVFVQRQEALPEAPTDPAELAAHPEKAAFTYLRNQCLRCHHAVKGRQVRGDYRGMGCSSCHLPYSNEGFYEGGDESIPHDEPGHPLVHTIQATRKAKVVVHGVEYSGIPVETCTTCHDRGKRIGVSFQGLMEIPYESPYTEGGGGQPALHTKHYLAMQQDVHYQKGMLCQDCHTSGDVHGDGFLAAANLGAVEIECSDCHGTPTAYPWELPLGFGDEFEERSAAGPPRGTANELPAHLTFATRYPAEDGYLLSARGNPLVNTVRRKDMVVVHTAGGKDLELKPLKMLARTGQLSRAGRTAMCTIGQHVDRMECYTCHAGWAPQCYGCHVKVDYSKQNSSFDWLAAGHRHRRSEHAADRGEAEYDTIIPGKVTEQRSFTRWEDPPLGVNGEGRVSPIAPGCQTSVTVVGPDGNAILLNQIFRTPAGTEGAGKEGQLAIDMSPTQPHTMTKHARSCESCHASEKALGYGIGGGRMTRPPDEAVTVDLETADHQILPKKTRRQFEAVKGLTADWSRVVTEDGRQLQTVGHHFKGSRPLNNDERARIDRQGVCRACHQEIPDQSLAINLLHHVAEYADKIPHTASEHDRLLHKILLVAGWAQILVAALLGCILLGLVAFCTSRWRQRRQKSKGRPD